MQIIMNDPVERKAGAEAAAEPVEAQFIAPTDANEEESGRGSTAGSPSGTSLEDEAEAGRPPCDPYEVGSNPEEGGRGSTEGSPSATGLEGAAEAAVADEPLSNTAVMAHTASLWKFLPLPADEPENAPQYGGEYQEYDGGRIIAARVRGKKHKHEGTNCDDWMEVAHCGDMALLAVSDGAGSKHYSRIGSRESCQAAISYLKRGLTALDAQTASLKMALGEAFDSPAFGAACGKLVQLVQEAVMAGRRAVEEAFEQRRTDEAYMKPLGREPELNDFAATLLVTLVIPVPFLRENLLISCQVGDGMIAAIDTQGDYDTALRLLADADSGEYSGETDFLTSSKMVNPDELKRRTKVSRCRADLIMAMTDGVSDDYDPNKPELYALYFDLVANNVLSERALNMAELTHEQAELLRATPSPVTYPWVNSPSVQVSLQYTENILAQFKMTLEELWERRDILPLASVGVSIKAEDRADLKLRQWLDNCTRRGSFDDRTLAIVQLRRRV